MFNESDTQIYVDVNYSYIQNYYATCSNGLKEGHLNLEGVKNRISDDIRQINKMNLSACISDSTS
jgi:hypothetical protein